mmetsp:Transcript_102919/g.290979  ORF Transcript_102919/g.290979 Transcript_102919/m.290979 type:complete len:205 (-) Transcript_102919:194-808(-)
MVHCLGALQLGQHGRQQRLSQVLVDVLLRVHVVQDLVATDLHRPAHAGKRSLVAVVGYPLQLVPEKPVDLRVLLRRLVEYEHDVEDHKVHEDEGDRVAVGPRLHLPPQVRHHGLAPHHGAIRVVVALRSAQQRHHVVVLGVPLLQLLPVLVDGALEGPLRGAAFGVGRERGLVRAPPASGPWVVAWSASALAVVGPASALVGSA